MKNLLSLENVVKFFIGVIMCAFTVAGLYYAIDKRLALIEQKMDYMVENYKEKEIEAKVQLAELKEVNKQFAKDLTEVNNKILRIFAVLPNKWYGKVEEEDDK